jgi:hypothetical protein
MNSSEKPDVVQPQVRAKLGGMLRTVFMSGMLVVLIVGGWLLNGSRDTLSPVPDAADIRSLEASFYDREQQEKVEFQVPRKHWDAILSTLLPARRDDHPAKWVGLGRLQFKLVNGDSYFVSLYSPASEPGAFAAGSTFESRVYYRGGNSSDLEKALSEAHKSAEESSDPAKY